MSRRLRRLSARHFVAAATMVVALVSTWQPVRALGTPTDRAAVEHALSRLTYGARPSDVDRVMAMGLEKWIDQQLTPSRIDDTALESRMPQAPVPPKAFETPQEAQRFSRQNVEHLAEVRIARAVYSERQLNEVMVDFWFNHFNVFARKGRTSQFVADYELDAIRPNIWGSFRNLLGATAHSPAMLFYLDNWLSVDPDAVSRQEATRNRLKFQIGGTPPPQQKGQRKSGLNENYGRELLELHTLGVDGGYTQKDIIEVARAFTGWTIDNPGRKQQAPAQKRDRAAQNAPAQKQDRAAQNAQVMMDGDAGRFIFTPAMHDLGAKEVLGHKIRAGGGINDGEQVLDIVAEHPSTARHIATKLVRRFVSDDPPESLVAKVAARFRETHGDLREVVRAVITSDEFFAAEARRAKVKNPLEFVVSAIRTTGRDTIEPRRVTQALQQLGMPLYGCEPPTGYDDTAASWISAGALVTRMNIAQMIAGPQGAATLGGPEFQRR
jgi:uncharacterized protein (DUF1800 family)